MNKIALPSPAPGFGSRQYGTRELLALVIRRRWIILAVSVPILVLATIGTMRTSASVTASGRVLVEPRRPETPNFNNAIPDYDVLMSTQAQVAMSMPVARKAAAALIDSLPSLRQLPSLAHVGNEGQLTEVLMGGVDASPVGEANILSVSFSHPEARFALMAAGAIMDSYIRYNIESMQNQPAVQYYTEQTQQVKAATDSLMALRAAVLMESGYSVYEDEARAIASQITGLEGEYFKVRSTRMGIEARLNSTREALAADPDFVPIGQSGGGASFANLKDMLEEQLADLAKLRQQYRDDSVWVQRQQELIADTRDQVSRARDGYLLDLSISLQEVRSREQDLHEAVEAQRTQLLNFPQIKHRVDAIDLDIQTRRDLLENLQNKRGEVALTSAADQRISALIPLNEPRLDTLVAGSKKVLYLALALFFGLALGFMAAFFAENQDHRIFDAVQVEQHLRLPVLGSVSKAGSVGEGP